MRKLSFLVFMFLFSVLLFCQQQPVKELKLNFGNCTLIAGTNQLTYSSKIEKNSQFLLVEMKVQEFSCDESNQKLKAIFKVSSSLFDGYKTFNYLYQVKNGKVEKKLEPINKFVEMIDCIQKESSLYEKNQGIYVLGTSALFTYFLKESFLDQKQLILEEFLTFFNLPPEKINDDSTTIQLPCTPIISTNASVKVYCGSKAYVVSVVGGSCYSMNDVGGACVSDCGSASVQCSSIGLDSSSSTGCGRID
jgi:hypothetical protein